MLEIGNGKIGTFLSNLTIIINIFIDIKKLMTFKGNSNFNVVLFISLLNELFVVVVVMVVDVISLISSVCMGSQSHLQVNHN